MPVQVIIKSAAQTVEDFSLDCEMTWTIAQVKDQISTLYPTKPKREHQKLIYGGKLLPDHLTLQSILNKMNDIHILHIVCPFSSVSIPQKSSVTKEIPAAPMCTASPPPNPSGIYPQVNPQILTPGLANGIPGIVNGVAYTSPDVAQQYLVMQQMYTQFMTQYFAQYNGNIPYTPVNPSPAPVQQPQTTAPRQNPAPQRQPEEEGRDYIDYLYMFSRVALLVAMLLFYSSFHRIMAVFVMVFLLTLFAKISRYNQRQELQRARERQNAEAAAAEQAAEEEAAATEDEQTTENATSAEASPTERPPPPATSVPATIFALVAAFFSSLIPTDPLPVHVN